MKLIRALVVGCLVFLGTTAGAAEALKLPHELKGKAVVLTSTDPDYARADVASAIKPVGEGGISEGVVIKLTEDIPVWRMWSGPEKKDSRGNTNRMGQWWGYDKPHGTQADYRTRYEICLGWNDLTWMAKCTLKKDSVIAIGPGNSVTAMVCGDPTGKESYPANAKDWQVWVSKAWSRSTELVCPADTEDYAVDLNNIAKKSDGSKGNDKASDKTAPK